MPGTLQWKESDVRTVESEGQVVLTVERRRGHNGEVTVQYDTKPKEALEGVDYVGAHGTLTFGHGVMSQTITIGIVDDTAYEKDERFLCILSEPTGGCGRGAAARTTAAAASSASSTWRARASRRTWTR